MPAGGGRSRLGGAGLAQEQAHDAAVAGTQCQPPAGGEVEAAGMAPDLGKDGGETTAAQRLLEDPEGFLRAPAAHDDEFSRVEAEAFEAGTIGSAGLLHGIGFGDQQEGTRLGLGKTGEKGEREAGGGDRIARGFAADLMEGVAAEAAAEPAIDTDLAKGKAHPAGGQGNRPALDLGDLLAQPGKPLPCHENACAHGPLHLLAN